MTDITSLEATLASLRGEPHRELLPAVLDRVGLADEWARVPTPLGAATVVLGPHGVRRLHLGEPDLEATAERHLQLHNRALRAGRAPAALVAALTAGRTERVRVDLRAARPFQRAVLDAIRSIPPGEVRSYGWVAERIDRPAAVRAVGTALATNPVPLIVPCHRVVRRDGRPGHYVFGDEAKVELLEAEGVALGDLPGLVGARR